MTVFSYVIIVVAFFAGVLKSGFGIGAGIFLTPILALVTDPKEAVVLVAPMMLFTDATATCQYWRQWSVKDILSLAPPCYLGAAAGVLLLNWFTPEMARRAIGVIGLVYVGMEVLKVGLRVQSSSRASPAVFPSDLSRGSRLPFRIQAVSFFQRISPAASRKSILSAPWSRSLSA